MGRPGRRREEAPEAHYTVREAAELLGVSETAVRQRMGRGTLPYTGPDATEGGEARYYLPCGAVEAAKLAKPAEKPPRTSRFT